MSSKIQQAMPLVKKGPHCRMLPWEPVIVESLVRNEQATRDTILKSEYRADAQADAAAIVVACGKVGVGIGVVVATARFDGFGDL
jgi:hypothetical protein